MGPAGRLPAADVDAYANQLAQRLRFALDAVDADIAAPTISRAAQRRRATTSGAISSSAPHPRGLRFSLSAAFACASVLAGAVGIVWLAGRHTKPQVTITRTYATRIAERAEVTLPDGSRLRLAPSTQAHYTQTTTGARRVTLTGEAHFTVTPDPDHPFVVAAGPVQARVLGTAFTVRRYATDSVTQVAVVTGKVAARNALGERVLTAGHVVQLGDSSVVTDTRDAATLSAWTTGQLVFKDTPVPVMLETVGRWCGYEFRLRDTTLARQHVTTSLSLESPRRTLQMVKELLGVTMTFDGSVVTLHAPRDTSRLRTAPGQPAPGRGVRGPAPFSPPTEVGK